MNLREIQASWNALVPLAQARNIKAKHWAVPPQTVDRGMRRLNWLRGRLGIVIPESQQPELAHSLGASLPPIRDIVAQYNALIPEAQERGIRNARLWTGIPSTSLRGMQRLQWLRRQLGQATAQVAPMELASVDPANEFDAMTWGVEIEALLPLAYDRQTLAADITAAGVKCQVEVLSHNTPTAWKIVTDGSLGNYTRGFELVSPVLTGTKGFEQMQVVCTVLKAKKVRVTQRCGLHVHVGWKKGLLVWKSQGLASLVRTYTHFESVIDSHMAPTRRGGHAGRGFCKSNKVYINHVRLNEATSYTGVIEAIGQSATTWRSPARYRKLNLQTLMKHGTVEFRHHHGTIEYDKINNWVRFCLRLASVSNAGVAIDAAETPKTPIALVALLRMPESEANHFQKRINHFAQKESRAAQRRVA